MTPADPVGMNTSMEVLTKKAWELKKELEEAGITVPKHGRKRRRSPRTSAPLQLKPRVRLLPCGGLPSK